MSGPLASGGLVDDPACFDWQRREGPNVPGDVVAQPAEKEDAPPVDDPAPAPALGSAVTTTTVPGRVPAGGGPTGGVTSGPPLTSDSVVESLAGGQVRLRAVDGALVLHAATPRPGFIVDLFFDRSDELIVTFWNGSDLSVLEARLTEDGLEVSTSERTR